MSIIIKKLLMFFSCCMFSFNTHANDLWVFYKVSSTDLFSRHDSNTIQNLNKLYGKAKVNMDDNTVTISNDLLESSTICSVDYSKKKESPLSYFYSKKTLDMYDNVFKKDKISLAKDIYILRSLYPDKTCPSPYDEIIESDEYVFFVALDYLVFFKKITNDSKESNGLPKGTDFFTFCKSVSEDSIFDGDANYICDFTNDDLSNTYLKLKVISLYNNILKESLPDKNISYHMGDVEISYQWIGSNEVKITIIQGMDEGVYLFKKFKSGTLVAITSKSGY